MLYFFFRLLCRLPLSDEIPKFIEDKKAELAQLCKIYDVKTMYVFGSVCTDRFNENSDIDILIAFNDIPIDRYTDNYFELHYKLEALLGRKIDLLTENSLSNPYFIESIEETKHLLYAA
jgi:predicted nucleotidyltransferase